MTTRSIAAHASTSCCAETPDWEPEIWDSAASASIPGALCRAGRYGRRRETRICDVCFRATNPQNRVPRAERHPAVRQAAGSELEPGAAASPTPVQGTQGRSYRQPRPDGDRFAADLLR